MKHQYFGDIGDYKKFNLLRSLSETGGLSVAVCWMLTPDDGSNDGRFTGYLKSPEIWRSMDKDVYDLLHRSVVTEYRRDLKIIEDSGLLTNSQFFTELIQDSATQRKLYFEQIWQQATTCDLIFFDPDNGIETASTIYGKRGSSKFLYWEEIRRSHELGFGTMIYQHFPRKERNVYMRELALKIMKTVNLDLIFAIRTRHAAFFISPNPRHRVDVEKSLSAYARTWGNHVEVQVHNSKSSITIDTSNQMQLL